MLMENAKISISSIFDKYLGDLIINNMKIKSQMCI